jgi:hypothetical protein
LWPNFVKNGTGKSQLISLRNSSKRNTGGYLDFGVRYCSGERSIIRGDYHLIRVIRRNKDTKYRYHTHERKLRVIQYDFD